jgi:hypothetical protein
MATKNAAESAEPSCQADWSQIEADYRAGVKTLRQMAAENGISEGAIRKRAKKEDWERDLAAKIREKADALVRSEAVRNEVRKETSVPEKEIVEANAVLQAAIRREQRTDISRSRKLVMSLLAELEMHTDNMDLLEQLSELLYDPNEAGDDKKSAAQDKRIEVFNKVISLSGRTSTMKSLADSLKTLVALEREAFGIDDRNKDQVGKTVFNMQF